MKLMLFMLCAFVFVKSSEYIGVSYSVESSKWVARRWSKNEKKSVYNGYYCDENTAAHASDTLARKLMENGEQGHKLNFPDDHTEAYPEELTSTSKYIGVCYNKAMSHWRASRWSKAEKKVRSNGHYKDEATAAHASDTLARKLMENGEQNLKLNFPDDDTEVHPNARQSKRKKADHDTNVLNVPCTENCPKNHALKRFKTTTTDYGCDRCGMSVDFPKGATMYGCRKCDFDLCENCHDLNTVHPSSKYIGVKYDAYHCLWEAQRWSSTQNKMVPNGYYSNEATAARASDSLARYLMKNGQKNHKLNFPDENKLNFPEE